MFFVYPLEVYKNIKSYNNTIVEILFNILLQCFIYGREYCFSDAFVTAVLYKNSSLSSENLALSDVMKPASEFWKCTYGIL